MLVMLHGLVELEAGFRESAVVFATTVGWCVVSKELELFLTSCNTSLRVADEGCRQQRALNNVVAILSVAWVGAETCAYSQDASHDYREQGFADGLTINGVAAAHFATTITPLMAENTRGRGLTVVVATVCGLLPGMLRYMRNEIENSMNKNGNQLSEPGMIESTAGALDVLVGYNHTCVACPKRDGLGLWIRVCQCSKQTVKD